MSKLQAINPSVSSVRIGALARRFGLRFPLIQAGMGGVAGPALAAAVSEAGAGGVVALFRMLGRDLEKAICRTNDLTERPYGVNLIPELLTQAKLKSQVGTVLASTCSRAFFCFYGIPDDRIIGMLLGAGRRFMIMVGTAEDAATVEAVGADALVLQGIESGGHLLGKHPLRQLLVEARERDCKLPILASGGIGSGSDFAELYDLGASGCVCGTLFVATSESRAHSQYKARIVEASRYDTLITNIFDGGWPSRPHRVLKNTLTEQQDQPLAKNFIAKVKIDGRIHPVARYSATLPTVDTCGHIDELPMYSGTSVDKVNSIIPAACRVNLFISEFLDSRPGFNG